MVKEQILNRDHLVHELNSDLLNLMLVSRKTQASKVFTNELKAELRNAVEKAERSIERFKQLHQI